MIVPMTKYAFVLSTKDRDSFLAKLQELGVLDVTSSAVEATDAQRTMITLSERYNALFERVKELRGAKDFV